MSTVAPPPPPAPSTYAPIPASDGQLVDKHIARTQRGLKLVDLSAALLTLAIGLLAFLLVAALLDHWVVPGGLGPAGRVVLFVAMAAAFGWYAWRALVPLLKPINPVYAAHTIEASSPTLKNSLLNLLLFRTHRQQMSNRVYAALEHQAAQRLSTTPVDGAVDRAALLRLGYALLAVITVIAIYAVLSPKNIVQSAGRVLAPWADIAPPSRVQILDIRPGDSSIARGDRAKISAEILGAGGSDAVRLHYSSADGQISDATLPMAADESGGRYGTNLPRSAEGVQQDLSYWIEAGDARSRKFKLTVYSRPTIVVQKVRYEFPSYTGYPSQEAANTGDVHGLEGTRVTIEALANQPIRSAYVDFDADGRDDQKMQVDGDRATTSFTLALRDDRRTPLHPSYILRFTAADGRANTDPVKYRIEVTADYGPEVRITKPEEPETKARVGDIVPIGVEARDVDFALSQVQLVGKVGDRDVVLGDLLSKNFEGRFTGLKPFVPESIGLKAGDLLEYWAEARDNRRPDANVTASDRRRLRITGGGPNEAGQRNQQPGGGGQGQQPNQDNGGGNEGNPQGDPQAGGQGQGEGQQGEQGQQGKQNSGGAGGDSKASPGGESGKQDPNQQQQGQGAGGQSQDSSQNNAGESQQSGGGNQQAQPGQQNNTQQQPPNDASAAGNQNNQGQSPPQQGNQSGAQSQPGAQGNQPQNQNGPPQPGQQPQGSPGGQSQGGDQQGNQQPVSSAGDDDGTAFQRLADELAKTEQNQGSGDRGQESEKTAQANQKAETGGRDEKPRDQAGGANEEGNQQGRQRGQPQGGSKGRESTNQQNQASGQQDQAANGEQQQGREQASPSDAQQSGANQEQSAAGAGQSSKENPTPPGKSLHDQGREKSPSDQKDSKESGEAPSDSQSKKESDSRGQTSGDQSGGGQEGSGQRADAKGRGEAGQHESSDQGAGQSTEEGEGDTGSEAGQDAKAEGKTGKSSENQPGKGSKSGDLGKKESGAGGQESGGEAGSDQKDATDGGGDKSQANDAGQKSGTSGEQSADQGKQSEGGGKQSAGSQGEPSDAGDGKRSEDASADQAKSEDPKGGESKEDQTAGGDEKSSDEQGKQGAQSAQDKADDASKQAGSEQKGGEQGGESGKAGESDSQKTAADSREQNSDDAKPSNNSAANASSGEPHGGSAGTRDRNAPLTGQAPPGVEEGADAANLDYASKQTDLVLNRLDEQLSKKRVDPSLLKSLGWTEEELARFVDRWKGLKSRAAGEGDDAQEARDELDGALRSLGLRPGGPRNIRGSAAADKLRDLNEGYRSRTPLEYSDRVRAYSKGTATLNEP